MTMCMYKKVCITNRNLVSGNYFDQIKKLVALEEIDYLIVREKDLSKEEYSKLAKQVIEICKGFKTTCILHSFKQVALECNHPYIHLTYKSFLELSEEERAFYKVIGVSTHSVEEAVKCQALGATYITASHIFPTACKEGLEPKGLSFLREVTASVSIPVYALGGIHEDNMDACIEAGAAGVCQMSEYMKK